MNKIYSNTPITATMMFSFEELIFPSFLSFTLINEFKLDHNKSHKEILMLNAGGCLVLYALQHLPEIDFANQRIRYIQNIYFESPIKKYFIHFENKTTTGYYGFYFRDIAYKLFGLFIKTYFLGNMWILFKNNLH